jgi:hypothetical protein
VWLGLGAARWNGPRVQGRGRAEWPAEQRAARGGRRKEKRGKELTCGPWLAEGEIERERSGWGGAGPRARAGPREEKEREERKPEGEKGSGPAWPMRKEEG